MFRLFHLADLQTCHTVQTYAMKNALLAILSLGAVGLVSAAPVPAGGRSCLLRFPTYSQITP